MESCSYKNYIQSQTKSQSFLDLRLPTGPKFRNLRYFLGNQRLLWLIDHKFQTGWSGLQNLEPVSTPLELNTERKLRMPKMPTQPLLKDSITGDILAPTLAAWPLLSSLNSFLHSFLKSKFIFSYFIIGNYAICAPKEQKEMFQFILAKLRKRRTKWPPGFL